MMRVWERSLFYYISLHLVLSLSRGQSSIERNSESVEDKASLDQKHHSFDNDERARARHGFTEGHAIIARFDAPLGIGFNMIPIMLDRLFRKTVFLGRGGHSFEQPMAEKETETPHYGQHDQDNHRGEPEEPERVKVLKQIGLRGRLSGIGRFLNFGPFRNRPRILTGEIPRQDLNIIGSFDDFLVDSSKGEINDAAEFFKVKHLGEVFPEKLSKHFEHRPHIQLSFQKGNSRVSGLQSNPSQMERFETEPNKRGKPHFIIHATSRENGGHAYRFDLGQKPEPTKEASHTEANTRTNQKTVVSVDQNGNGQETETNAPPKPHEKFPQPVTETPDISKPQHSSNRIQDINTNNEISSDTVPNQDVSSKIKQLMKINSPLQWQETKQKTKSNFYFLRNHESFPRKSEHFIGNRKLIVHTQQIDDDAERSHDKQNRVHDEAPVLKVPYNIMKDQLQFKKTISGLQNEETLNKFSENTIERSESNKEIKIERGNAEKSVPVKATGEHIEDVTSGQVKSTEETDLSHLGQTQNQDQLRMKKTGSGNIETILDSDGEAMQTQRKVLARHVRAVPTHKHKTTPKPKSHKDSKKEEMKSDHAGKNESQSNDHPQEDHKEESKGHNQEEDIVISKAPKVIGPMGDLKIKAIGYVVLGDANDSETHSKHMHHHRKGHHERNIEKEHLERVAVKDEEKINSKVHNTKKKTQPQLQKLVESQAYPHSQHLQSRTYSITHEQHMRNAAAARKAIKLFVSIGIFMLVAAIFVIIFVKSREVRSPERINSRTALYEPNPRY